MPLVVPALRLLFVFLNIYDTFKILKLPPPSARNGGQPSVRAMSQRKRAMKGCMTVWLVWSCFAVYENTLDGIIGLFIPFYNEVKAILILFFILTRARGAEPIFLHLMRPLIKPYVATLDILVHVIHSAGDLLLLVVNIPIEFVLSRYRRWSSTLREARPLTSTTIPVSSVPSSVPNSTDHGTTRTRQHPPEAPRAGMSSAKDAAASSSSSHQYEFWHPPQSSHSDAGFLPHSQDSSHFAPVASVETVHDEEWRKYEAFPSAYPPTPYVPGRDLPHQGHDRVEGITEEEALKAEEWRKYEPFPSAYPATPLLRRRQLPSESQQIRNSLNQIEENGEEDECSEEWHGIGANSNPSDFRVSLEPQHELSSPEHVDGLSDELAPNPGVQIIVTRDDGNMDIDDDEDEREADDDDMGDEEDDFNVTLRTPLRVSRRHNFSQASTATEGSQSNSSTGLNTSDSGQLLRTRLNPEVPSNFDSALAAGRKRPLPITENDELRSRVQKLEAVRAVGVNVRRRPTVQTRLSATTSRQSSSEPHVTNNHSREGYEGKERSNDSSGPSRMSKRRRVVPPAQARPGSSRTNSARTNSAGTVSGVTASTQPHEPVAATSSRKPSRATPPLLPPKAPNSTTIHTYQPVPVPACTGTDNPPLPPSKPSRAAANFSGRPTRSAARK